MCSHTLVVLTMRMIWRKNNTHKYHIQKIFIEMEKDEIDTSYYNGIAVPERPIIIDNIPIYGVLYNQAEEELLKMKNMGTAPNFRG